MDPPVSDHALRQTVQLPPLYEGLLQLLDTRHVVPLRC